MKYLVLIIGVINCSLLIGQTTILFEDFNNGFPAGWQLMDEDGLTPNSSSAVNFIDEAFVIHEDYDSLAQNDSIIIATSWFTEPGESDDWIILPNVTLGSIGNYISFDAMSVDESYPDGLEIRVSPGGVNIWDFFVLEPAYENVAMAPNWTRYKVSLDSIGVANQSVFIAFRHVSNDNYILALDNIQVTIDDPVSVHENTLELRVHPNPSTGEYNFSNLINGYCIYDLSGRVILSSNQPTNQIDLSDFDNGIYWIQELNGAKIKLIKR